MNALLRKLLLIVNIVVLKNIQEKDIIGNYYIWRTVWPLELKLNDIGVKNVEKKNIQKK